MAQEAGPRIIVDVAKQQLSWISPEHPDWVVPVSTSKYGVGCESGSWKTPAGRFRICEKIGETAPAWAVFKGRRWTGAMGNPEDETDQVLTRILWLEGLEPENANTRDRYVYIHGTNAEERIGTPASIGCVRMRNDDIIQLFPMVSVGTPVCIVPE